MTIDLNTNPYFDDHVDSKNYLKILFKPGYAVQARELTQLQTALQKQISRFGSHVFKNGSVVLNGQTTTNSRTWIDVVTLNNISVNDLVGKTINQGNVTARVLLAEPGVTTSRLYFVYTSGGSFASGTISGPVGTGPVGPWTAHEEDVGYANMGVGQLYSIVDSVFYVDGHFVFCEAQTTVLSDGDDPEFYKKVGLTITDSIVTVDTDETLLDPALGSYNFAAPGADRYTITLTLGSYVYNPEDQTDQAYLGGPAANNFIELSRFEAGALLANVTHANYSDLETTLARRTFDESGDYTVKPFRLKIKDHVFGNAEKLSLAIEPGKAYIKGFEFETIATLHKDMDRALDFASVNGRGSQVDFGSYILINVPTSAALDFSSNPSINLRNVGNTVVGTAIVTGISWEGTPGTVCRLHVQNVTMNTGVSISTVTSVINGSWTTTTVSPTALVSAFKKPKLVRLSNPHVKTLLNVGVSDTSYVARASFAATFVTGVVVLNTGSAEEFFGNSPADYVVVKDDGTYQEVASVTGSGSTRTITLSASVGIAATVYASVYVNTALQKTKSFATATVTGLPISLYNPISLGYSDCYKISNITARDTAGSPIASRDVTALFDFNNGQTDELYDHGYIKLKAGVEIDAAYDVLDVTFSYFTQVTTNGFFSVDSYSGITEVPYADIYSYTSSSGEVYDLRDCLDFRPRRTNGASAIVGGRYPVTSSAVVADFQYYLSRIDKLALTKERQLSLIKGIPAENPTVPRDLYDAMTLYIINVPAYTASPKDVSFFFVENKRYTMRDIGKIEKRVERMEYYTSLSLLEKQAADEKFYDDGGLERFKNGILVDSFAGHSVGEVGAYGYSCSIEPETRILRPQFSPHSYNYVVNTGLTTAKIRGPLAMLPYTTETLVEQPWATNFVNVNPYMTFNWNGMLTLDPPGDTWVDTTTLPDVNVNINGANDAFVSLVPNVDNPASVGTRWNDWQTVVRGVTTSNNVTTNTTATNVVTTNAVTTTVTSSATQTGIEIAQSAVSTITSDLGSKVVDVSLSPFIRSQVVRFGAKNLRPNTELLASFDGVNVTEYCTPATEVIFTASISAHKGATRVTSGSKGATVIMMKSDRAFVIMDPVLAANAADASFVATDIVSWVGSSSGSTSTVSSVINNKTDLTTNSLGDVAGVFLLPNNERIKFRTGEKMFRLADVLGQGAITAAEVKYVAQGLSQSVDRTIVSTRVATASINPVTNTEAATSSSSTNNIVSSVPVIQPTQPTQLPAASSATPPSIQGVACNQATKSDGKQGTFSYTLDFGTVIGDCGIKYQAYQVPDRYTIAWDGKTYTSGFVGQTRYNRQLDAAGFPNVSGPGSGTLTFFKSTAEPRTAVITVDAPLSGTLWNFAAFCPATPNPVTPALDPINLSFSIATSTVFVVNDNGSLNYVTASILVTRLDGSKNTYARVTLPGPSSMGVLFTSVHPLFYTLSSTGVAGTTPITSIVVKVGTPTHVQLSCPKPVRRVGSTGNWEGDSYTLTIPTTALEYTDASATIRTSAAEAVDTDKIRVLTVGPQVARPKYVDPIAQTFFIDGRTYPNGVFIHSIDIFFKRKSATLPAQVQIRPVVNGYPSSGTILPFGTAEMEPSEINISVDGSVATEFVFENVVHLAPGEYSFVVLAASDEYEIFTASIGDFMLNSDGTEGDTQRITTQPTMGSMFKSQNASTWTPEQETDVKFKLKKCVFDTTQRTAVFNTDIGNLSSIAYNTSAGNNSGTPGNLTFDVFYTTGEVVDFEATTIDSYYSINNGAWNAYQLGTNVTMPSEQTFVASDPTSVRFQTFLQTEDVNVTPIIDTARLSNVLVHNIVNTLASNDTTELEPQGGAAYSRYITRSVSLNHGFESTDLRVFFNANLPGGTGVRVYYKLALIEDLIFNDNPYTEMELAKSGTYTETGFPEYQYRTPVAFEDVYGNSRAYANGDKFKIFAIKIVMTSSDTTKVPQIRDLRVVAFDD